MLDEISPVPITRTYPHFDSPERNIDIRGHHRGNTSALQSGSGVSRKDEATATTLGGARYSCSIDGALGSNSDSAL